MFCISGRAYHSGIDPYSGGSAYGFSGGRKGTRVPARRDSTQESLAHRPGDRRRARQLTDFAPDFDIRDFDIRDFDISPDGREVVLERAQERSDVVLLDLP